CSSRSSPLPPWWTRSGCSRSRGLGYRRPRAVPAPSGIRRRVFAVNSPTLLPEPGRGGARHVDHDPGRQDMSSTPLISMLIATRNAARDLPRCLDSIRAQTFRDFEVLVGDGASTDGTMEIVRAASDIVTYWHSEPDNSPYVARNRLLPHAKGEWICIMNADDWFLDSRALESLAPHLLTAMPRFRVVYSKLRQITPDGRVVAEAGRPWEEARESFRSHVC